MAIDNVINGGSNTAGKANVDAGYNLKVSTSLTPAYIGGTRNFSENDAGLALGGVPYLASPEVDDDFRMRVSNDIILDEEDCTYTAQNFTKHAMYATTFVPSWTSTGFNTNPTSSIAASAAVCFKTYKTFSMEGTETLSLDLEGAFSAAIAANNTIEFGFGLTTNTTPYDCFDGTYIRATNNGVFGVVRNNSATDTQQTAAFKDTTGATWVPVATRKYQFITYLSPRETEYWINDPIADVIWLAGSIPTPAGYGAPIGSQATSMFVRQVHGITGPATACSFTASRYNVRRGGTNIGTTLNVLNARSGESILSPGTLTTSANQTVTTGSLVATAAAVPANTTSLLASLSGKVIETLTLAAGTDGILMSYQCPALPVAVGTTYAPNRRLRIDAVNIASWVSTVIVGGPVAKAFYLAWGSTSLSLAGVAADTVTTKAYRRMMIPIVQGYGAAAGVGSVPSSTMSSFVLQTPIYVNPGEFVALVTTNSIAATSGAATHQIMLDFSWE